MMKKVITGKIRESDCSEYGSENTVEGLDEVLCDIVNEINRARNVKHWWDTDVTVKVTVEVVKVEEAEGDDDD